MLDALFNSGSLATSKAALEASWKSHGEAAHNLNNADTPGFQAQHTDFRALLLEKQGDMPEKGEVFQAYLAEVQPEREELNICKRSA